MVALTSKNNGKRLLTEKFLFCSLAINYQLMLIKNYIELIVFYMFKEIK